MSLPVELLSEFAKLTTDNKKTKSETTVYGTTVSYNGRIYVKLDGSELLTPVTTTTNMAAGERVTVLLKNHSAIVTGNITSPSATSGDISSTNSQLSAINDKIAKFESITAGSVTTEELAAERARIDSLESENVIIRNNLNAANGDIDKLEANVVTINETLDANEANIKTLQTEKLNADTAAITYATINSLNAVDADFHNLESTYAAFTKTTTDSLTAIRGDISLLESDKLSAGDAAIVYATIGSLDATNANITVLEGEFSDFKTSVSNQLVSDKALIESLEANKVSAKDIEGKYANIDFSNISKATMEYFYSESGLIRDVTVGDATITGHLVGVTISGDLIEGNTIKAEKLVIKGTDGLYYKLNTDGVKTEAEQTDVNSLNGELLQAKSITATKISVDDLVAFDATIGGFNITEDAIYSGVKSSPTNTTRGVYLDSTGQMGVGDSDNFIKYYKDQNGDYRLEISADSLKLTTGNTDVETVINELAESTATNSADLTNFISAINSEMEHMQTQIDGSISTWFYAYVPTTSNIPASSWNTTDLKNAHLGDLFYDTDTGYCYRWQLINNTYSWNRITDVDVTKALSDAAKAQSTADNKGRIFVSTPTTPYDVGDLWVQGTSGDIMRCQTTKTASQSYAAADWVKASKYTDDTKANAAKSAADAAQADVNAVETRMTAAETQITQNKEQIALRATKTELTSLSSDLSNNYYTKSQADSALIVKANEISSSVSSTYATKTALNTTNANVTSAQNTANSAVNKAEAAQSSIDNLEVGGRNLLRNTTTALKSATFSGWQQHLNGAHPFVTSQLYRVSGTQELTLSAYIENVAGAENIGLMIHIVTPDTASGYKQIVSGKSIPPGESGWVSVTGKVSNDNSIINATNVWVSLRHYSGSAGESTVNYHSLKLEFGNKATDWTPAPEDVDASIDEIQNGVVDLEARVTEAETNIEQHSDAIALRATKTEVSTAKSEAISSANTNTANQLKNYSTTSEMNSAINLKADAITSSVSSTYATISSLNATNSNVTKAQQAANNAQSDIDNLSIGGRNLIRDSRLEGNFSSQFWSGSVTKRDGYIEFTRSTSGSSRLFFSQHYVNNILLVPEVGETYTISIDLKAVDGVAVTSGGSVFWRIPHVEDGSYIELTLSIDSNDITDEWQRFYYTKTLTPASGKTFGTSTQLSVAIGNGIGGIAFKNIKLEKGNKPTQWSPAPEDFEVKITDLDSRVVTAESSITQLSSKITANVTETTALGTRMSTVEQTASGLSTRLTATETVANAAKKQLYHSADGTSGTAGYVGICTITVTNTYTNRPILFELNNRGKQSSNVSFCFSNANSKDPALSHLQYDGGIEVWAYKKTTSVWELIVKKSEDYDTIYVKDFANNNGGVTVTWTNVHYNSLPTSDITAGSLLAGKILKSVVDNAAKTATNYLEFSSSGLVVGDMTASTLGKNVLIDSDSVDIRTGTTTLASFGANEVILGQNSSDSVINLCDGAGTISAQISEASTSYPEYDSILIASQEINTSSQRFVTDVTNSYGVSSTPTYQNDGEIYMLSYQASAGSYARMKGSCTTTSSGDMTQTGVSAAALNTAASTSTSLYAEFWDESAGSWTQSNQVKVYPTKTTATKPIWIQGVEFSGTNKVLWSGGYYMSDTQTATLSESVTAQANGIVLVWSYYTDGASDNSNFQMTYIPKHFITLHPGKGVGAFLTNGTMNIVASKYVYISNTSIKGYAGNDDAATEKTSGITSTNKNFVLRYVIGV